MAQLSTAKRQALLVDFVDRMSREGSWAGETHIQKCVFVLQETLRVPLGFDFILYKHGPFSFDLRDELTVMKAGSFLESEPRHPYGPSHKVGPRGRQLQRRFPRTCALYSKALEFVAKSLSTKHVAEMERIATAVFVGQHNPTADAHQRAVLVTELKPHISQDDAVEAVNEAVSLERKAKSL